VPTLIAPIVLSILLTFCPTPLEWVPECSGEISTWRRTADGWEQSHTWFRQVELYDPPLHPLVVATLQALAALFVLTAFARTSPDRPFSDG
jgi:hypothetical protein